MNLKKTFQFTALAAALLSCASANATIEFHVPVRGLATQLPVNFIANTDTLDFGSVIVGNTSTKTIAVTNTGGAALTVNPASGPTGYSVTNNCSKIAPNGQCSVSVSFTPTQQQNYLGDFTLTAVGGTTAQKITVRGAGNTPNYATLDPSTIYPGYITLSNGNLTATNSQYSGGSLGMVAASKPKSSGKWYFEASLPSNNYDYCALGLIPQDAIYKIAWFGGWAGPTNVYYANYSYIANQTSYAAMNLSWNSQTIGVAYDLDNMTVTFVGPRTYGPYSLNAPAGTSYVPAVTVWGNCTRYLNFGQQPFVRTVPSGYNKGLF